MQNNKNRILAVDLARGLSIMLVIVVHTLWIYGSTETQANTTLGAIIHLIGKGTPMFLIAMGVSFTLSRNQSLFLSFKRALYILGVGFLMNFLKFIVPILFGFMPDSFIKAYGWAAPVTTEQMTYLLLTGDILQLAGVSLLCMGILNHVTKNKYAPLIIAIVIAIVTKEVSGLRLGIPGVDYVLDLFWGAEWNVYFAVFPWFSFILLGMFLGRWYQETNKNVSFIFKRMLLLGIALLVLGGGLCYMDYVYHFGDYFHLGPGGVIYLAGFNVVSLWGCHKLTTRIRANKVFSFFYYTSKRVTTLYIIQWVVICWGMGILGYQRFEAHYVLLLIPLFMAITLLIQKALDLLKAKRAENSVSPQVQPKRGVST